MTDLEHLHQFHRQVQVAAQFEFALHDCGRLLSHQGHRVVLVDFAAEFAGLLGNYLRDGASSSRHTHQSL